MGWYTKCTFLKNSKPFGKAQKATPMHLIENASRGDGKLSSRIYNPLDLLINYAPCFNSIGLGVGAYLFPLPLSIQDIDLFSQGNGVSPLSSSSATDRGFQVNFPGIIISTSRGAGMNWILELDYALFRIINGLAGRNALLDGAMKGFCNDHFVPFTLGFALVLFALTGRSREEDRWRIQGTVEVFLTIIISAILLQLLTSFIHRPRPFVDHQVNLLYYRPTDWSFPSNPATATFSFYFAARPYHRGFSRFFLALAAAMSFSRVFCGVHYPGDIIAGLILAAFSAWMARKFDFLGRPFHRTLVFFLERARSRTLARE